MSFDSGLIPTSQSSNLVDELFGEKECPKVGVSEDEESEDELDPSAGQSVSEDAAMAALRQHRESKYDHHTHHVYDDHTHHVHDDHTHHVHDDHTHHVYDDHTHMCMTTTPTCVCTTTPTCV